MNRRQLLTAFGASAALLAGCINGSIPAGDNNSTETEATSSSTSTNQTDMDTEDGETTNGHEGTVTLNLQIHNSDDTSHDIDIEITHIATPACRYSEPGCGQPSKETGVLDNTYEVAADSIETVSDVSASLTTDIDKYGIEIETDDGAHIEVAGIEADAKDTVDDFDTYDWHVSPTTYDIEVTLTETGEIDITVTTENY